MKKSAEPSGKINHWRNFWGGAGQALVIAPHSDYIHPRGGFARDARAMHGDFARVGRDMGYALKKYGEGE